MKKEKIEQLFEKPEFYISAGGLLALATVFALWLFSAPHSAPAMIAAFCSAGLFAAVCLRFVPEWTRFWRTAPTAGNLPERRARRDTEQALKSEPKYMTLRIFAAFLLVDAAVLLAVYILRRLLGGGETNLAEGLHFWTGLDSAHYLDIARDWYLSEGIRDRLVQLVFLPGYPLAIRAVSLVVGNDLYAALIVSALSFAGAGCVFYRLLRLDLPHGSAVRALKYLCILPGAFFFAAPMTESLFLLLCLSCVYLARKGKWILGYALGGLAAFTRSPGLTLLAPLLFELVHAAREETWNLRRLLPRLAALLLIPAGFAAYCVVNYTVSGNPFQFLVYQREHWHQGLGWFFNTAAYQTDYAVGCFGTANERLMGLWLPNLLAGFAALGVTLPAVKKLRASETAWFLGYYAVVMGTTWLLSGPRYLAAMPVLPKALAVLTEKRRADNLATAICSVLYILYLLAFVKRWQVW